MFDRLDNKNMRDRISESKILPPHSDVPFSREHPGNTRKATR